MAAFQRDVGRPEAAGAVLLDGLHGGVPAAEPGARCGRDHPHVLLECVNPRVPRYCPPLTQPIAPDLFPALGASSEFERDRRL